MRNVTLSSHVPNSPAPSHHSQQIKPQELVNKGKEQKVDIKDIIAKMSGMSRDEVLLPKEKEEFLKHVKKIYGEDIADLGCIVLKNLVFYEKPVSIQECGIDFSPYIVSGKTITNEDCEKIKAAKEY